MTLSGFRITGFLAAFLLAAPIFAQVPRVTDTQTTSTKTVLPSKADPGTPTAQELWLSTSTTDILKYRNAGGTTTYSLVNTTSAQTLTNKTLTAPTITGGTATALTSLGIRSTGTGAFDLTIANTENLTAGRTLTIATGDAARTITLSGNPTLNDWFNQSVKTSASPSFAGLTLSSALTVANGGTGAGTFTANNILTGNGTSALQASGATITSSGNVLTFAGGSTWTDASGGVAIAASGTNQNVTLTPSGTGVVVAASAGLSGSNTIPAGATARALEVAGTFVVNAPGFGPQIEGRRFGTSYASPSAVTSGQTLLNILGNGYNGTSFTSAASTINISAAANWSNTSNPTAITFNTAPIGATSNQIRVRVENYGGLSFGVNPPSGGTAAWGVNGVISNTTANTWTDNSSSGTVASAVASSFASPTFAASSSTTFTNAANVYIAGDVAAGTNVTLTNSYGLWNGGKSRLEGNIGAGSLTPTTSATFRLGGSGASTPNSVWINTAGNPLATFYAETSTSGAADLHLAAAATGSSIRPVFVGRRSSGTLASPTTVANNDQIFSFLASGYDGTSFLNNAAIDFTVDGAVSTSTVPISIIFLTGTTSRLQGGRFDSYGRLYVGVTGRSVPAWGTTGTTLVAPGASFNDTTSSGTVATAVTSSFGVSSFLASSSTTYTDAATVYIAGAPIASTNVTITNSYGLWNVGQTRLDGVVRVGSTVRGQAFTNGITFGGSGQISLDTANNQNITLNAGTGSIVGGANNMTLVAGTGNSRTLTLQTTTSGGTATTALSIDAVQNVKFAAGVQFSNYNAQSGTTYTLAASDTAVSFSNGSGCTLTLGTATNGRSIIVRTTAAATLTSASSNVVPLAGGAAGTAILAATAGKWAVLQGDGTNWQIVAAN